MKALVKEMKALAKKKRAFLSIYVGILACIWILRGEGVGATLMFCSVSGLFLYLLLFFFEAKKDKSAKKAFEKEKP